MALGILPKSRLWWAGSRMSKGMENRGSLDPPESDPWPEARPWSSSPSFLGCVPVNGASDWATGRECNLLNPPAQLAALLPTPHRECQQISTTTFLTLLGGFWRAELNRKGTDICPEQGGRCLKQHLAAKSFSFSSCLCLRVYSLTSPALGYLW